MQKDTMIRPHWEMFALSFTGLFLEMMVIRWVPSVVYLVAYYANLMLLSSFLGLGVGLLVAGRGWRLFEWFPWLLLVNLGVLWLCRYSFLGASAGEARFYAQNQTLFNSARLVLVFAANAALFVPLGERMSRLFDQLPRLKAYAWDLGGSLCGTLAFGLFSLTHFSPVLGFVFVMGLFLVLSRRRLFGLPAAAAALLVVWLITDRTTIWSPYYAITVSRFETQGRNETDAPADLRTMRNPPIYYVQVNRLGYHFDASFDPARYDRDNRNYWTVTAMAQQYRFPYAVLPHPARVLIVGAGGGVDVEAALAMGAGHVDAVEIDPGIAALSHRFSAADPYSDPRVTLHIDDARAHIKRAAPGSYDLVAFGFLDSQALFSSMSNVRLDGFVYTVESLRSAYGLLKDDGVLALSFYMSTNWLGPKLFSMMASAIGHDPALYVRGDGMILLAPKNPAMKLPAAVGDFHRVLFADQPAVPQATDDWPFLYLKERTIPKDYLVAIGSLLGFSLLAIVWLGRGAGGFETGHFLLLGAGFLLLETKSIGDCTLYFGTTWFVSLVVITGVLAMVMAANLVAGRLSGYARWLYLPLVAALLVIMIVPRDVILECTFGTRLLWSLLAVPLPVFFAGLIFSTTFRGTAAPGRAFGANLIGAMIGGFCEYLTMAVGSSHLSLLLLAFYLGSFVLVENARRRA